MSSSRSFDPPQGASLTSPVPLLGGSVLWPRDLRQEQEVTAQSTSSLHDMFLKHVQGNRIEVTIFLPSGIRLQGQII